MAINISSGELLTPEQLKKHFVVYAGPGSGKTHFLVNNIKNIISTNSKIKDSNERKVLCITYTNAAVNEIQRRLENVLSAVYVDTIHGFIIQNIILPFQSDLKRIMKQDFDIEVVRKRKITSQIEGLGILHGIEKEEINEYLRKELSCTSIDYSKKILGEVEVDNITFINNGTYEFKHSSRISKNHIKEIKKYVWETVGKLTHDEILYFGYRMIQENSTIAYSLRVKYPFVFVDEFQDTNPLQTFIIKFLGQASSKIGVIGDVAQSIYSFQGAQPSQFLTFTMPRDCATEIYNINGNRRSTNNIVQLCNFLRSSDDLSQTSIKPYKNDEEKQESENNKICFLVGNSSQVMQYINKLVEKDAVVLTRTWADAFAYIQGIDEQQRQLLKDIYNRYYSTSIDIRSDIVEHYRVTWVRAFRFIMMLHSAYQNGAFVDVINAVSLYNRISKTNIAFAPKAILEIRELLFKTFENITADVYVCDIIDKFNSLLNKNAELKQILFSNKDFSVIYLSEFDDQIADKLKKIRWDTANRLFKEVFAKDAKYMTVHQAKGLEWDTVIVGVNPTSRDKTDLIKVFSNPSIRDENPMDEFVRIYYVACSRARKSLYIHIPEDSKLISTIKENVDLFKQKQRCNLDYSFISIS